MEDQNERFTIAQPGQITFLGHQGENLARRVIFDLSDLRERYPEGRFALAVQRKGDALPYPAARTNLDGDALVWTLTDADTAVAGYGRCELRCYDGETLAKSEVWQTFTLPALAETGEAPEAWADYVAQLQRIGTQVQAAQEHAPRIGENGNWQIWNTATEQYIDTGLPSRGEPGDTATADSVFVARVNSTTSAEIEAAYQAGKVVLVPIAHFNAVARLTGRDDAVTHHFGAVFSDSNAENLVAVHVTCANDSWHVVAKTPLANRANLANNLFSEESAYSVGDYVLYRNMLYRFTAAHTGAWAAGDAVRVQLADDVQELRAALDDKAAATSVPASASVSAAGALSFANSAGTQLFTVQLPLYAGGVS